MSGFPVLFLTRPGCHLCEEARPLVTRAAARAGVGLTEVNVDEDDSLLAIYGLRIPVVLSGAGNVLAEGRIDDEKGLRRAFGALAGQG